MNHTNHPEHDQPNHQYGDPTRDFQYEDQNNADVQHGPNMEQLVDQYAEENARLKEAYGKMAKFIEKVMAEKKSITTLVAGPVEVETQVEGEQEPTKHLYFRIADNKLAEATDQKLFPDTGEYELGKEAILVENALVGMLPRALVLVMDPPVYKKVSWSDIGGLKNQLKTIQETVQYALKNSDVQEEFGLKPVKGMLLEGPPGCGKTLIATAIATDVLGENAPPEAFMYIKGAELLSKWVGETENSIRAIFTNARVLQKKTGIRAVLFIDEADALLPPRGSRVSSDVETTIVPTFLAEMDGLEKDGPFVILSSNRKDGIDDAILREGRIDLKLRIDRPDADDAVEIFHIHLKTVKTFTEKEHLAQKGVESLFASSLKSRVSGSMIAGIVNLAAQSAISRAVAGTEERGINFSDLDTAIHHIIDKE